MKNITGTVIDDELLELFLKGLKNNTYKHHQFYNINIQAAEQHFIRFMEDFKESTKDKVLNKAYYDIEVVGDGETFPDPIKVEFPVTSIALYNNIKNIVYVFSLIDPRCNLQDHQEIYNGIIDRYNKECLNNKFYKVKDLQIELKTYNTDTELLKDYFDICISLGFVMLKGFNNKLFDDPYIINRAEKLFGESYENIVSEFGQVNKYNNNINIPDYKFVDLLKLYQPVDSGGSGLGQSLANYKLNTIAEIELKATKLEFEGSYLDFYLNDIAGFLAYNLFDTILTYKLDQKLTFTELIYDIAKYNNSTFGAAIDGRSIMYEIRNNLHYSKKNEMIRATLFSQEVLYGFE